jgi:hypothetical protein
MTDIPKSERLWSDIVEEIDPKVTDTEETAYEFSNGRKFVRPADPYGE